MNDILTALQPVLTDLLVLVAGAVATVIGLLVLKAKDFIVAKIGGENYNRAINMAFGIWHFIQDNFPGITSDEKIQKMEEMLLEKFPKLTQVELDAINKCVHKQIGVLTTPVEEE